MAVENKAQEVAPLPGGRGVTRWTRTSLGVQVTLVVLLGIAVAALLIHVFDRSALRARADLTVDGRNSLDPQTVLLLKSLPGTVEVDLFMRPPNDYLQGVWREAVQRANDLLLVAREAAPGSVFRRQHDLSDFAAVETRFEELGVEPASLRTQTPFGDLLAAAVVSLGDRRTVLRFLPDGGDADWGDGGQRSMPRILSWRGEEAFAEALAKISTTDRPRAYFSVGHGEASFLAPDLDFGKSVTALAEDLSSEGYELAEWEVETVGPVPDDADLLIVGAPREPYSDAGITALRAYLARGGRVLLAAPERYVEDDPLFPLLTEHGMLARRGIVTQAIVDPSTGRRLDGDPKCVLIRSSGKDTSSSHPVTRLLWERDRDLLVNFSRSFGRGTPPEHGLLFDLVATPVGCWLDLPGADGLLDFRYDGNTEERGQFRLAMAATWPAKNSTGETIEGRLIGIPGPGLIEDRLFTYNREFALSAIDWLADRSFRVRIPGRDPFRSTLDLARDQRAGTFLSLMRFALPLASLGLGLLLFFFRRRQ